MFYIRFENFFSGKFSGFLNFCFVVNIGRREMRIILTSPQDRCESHGVLSFVVSVRSSEKSLQLPSQLHFSLENLGNFLRKKCFE